MVITHTWLLAFSYWCMGHVQTLSTVKQPVLFLLFTMASCATEILNTEVLNLAFGYGS